MGENRKPDRINARRSMYIIWILVVFFVFPACDLLSGVGPSNESTLSVLEATQTSLERVILTLTGVANETALSIPSSGETITPPAGIISSEIAPMPTNNSTVIPSTYSPDERLMKSANILLFEDMSASSHIRYVKEALDREGYFYQDVGSAKGWFKSLLLSSIEWDLVIAAAEARRDFGGEFFPYIDDQIERGAGAIIEYYDVDAAPYGKIKPLLDRCGVEFQSDWYEPEMRVFFWTDPDQPVFNYPNEIPNALRNAQQLWNGDVGDLLMTKERGNQPTGDAHVLAGTNANWKTDHATLVTCLDGRVILQTFSSHEYHHNDIVPLWQNYIYQTLKSHFELTGGNAPTPAVTVLPAQTTPEPIHSESTPGPAYGYPYSCGGIITAQLQDAPHFQKDLFEHHAKGTYVILKLQLINQTETPIFIWDQDYFLEADLNGTKVTHSPDKAATGYLYIDSPTKMSQSLIEPGELWRTRLAFDVDPESKGWDFVIKPGSEFGEQVCEVRIPLSK